MTSIYYTQICPKCKANLQGIPIPSEDKKFYGDRTHYSRLIGIEYSYDHPNYYDGISEWQCPDCGYKEERRSCC